MASKKSFDTQGKGDKISYGILREVLHAISAMALIYNLSDSPLCTAIRQRRKQKSDLCRGLLLVHGAAV